MKTKSPIPAELYQGGVLPVAQISDHPDFPGVVSRVVKIDEFKINEKLKIIRFEAHRKHYKDNVEVNSFKSEIESWTITANDKADLTDATTMEPVPNPDYNETQPKSETNHPFKQTPAFEYFAGMIVDAPLALRAVMEMYIARNDEKYDMYDNY